MDPHSSRGAPPVEEEYQGPSWWHFSRLADARRNVGMRKIAVIGLVVLAVSILTGILNVVWNWNGIPLPFRLGSIELSVTIFPPFILSLLAAVWLGPTWVSCRPTRATWRAPS
jgi:hypothetical protein